MRGRVREARRYGLHDPAPWVLEAWGLNGWRVLARFSSRAGARSGAKRRGVNL